MTAVKFCGLRSEADVETAICVGCDVVGLNFVSASPRVIDTVTASKIVGSFGSNMLFTGVFKDQSESEIRRVLNDVALDFLQFSGDESAAFCDSFDMPYLKGLKVSDSFDFEQARDQFPRAFAYLLDSMSDLGGGSGKTFDWKQFPTDADAKVILAGGLTPSNVAMAIQETRPWGVDVASGIENDDHSKNRELMVQFMQGVRNVSA
ncbi:MAG: phosphoribosylanthranilate isomerase [Gammaproteobacteria bacterium]|nr:phosphoribosylanthranilate isomerase [Gammaproteobacteria bacterium]